MRISPEATLQAFKLAMTAPHSIANSAIRSEAATLMDRVHTFLRRKREDGLGQPLALMARITPLDDNGRPHDAREVQLRELNLRSFSFEHRQPLKNRRAMLLVDDPRFGRFEAEIDLSWCRYLPGGKYNSGGRFVEK